MTDAELTKHLDAAEKSPKEIAAAVSGLAEQILRYKPSPDKWCVLEILGHLADVEIIYGYRLRQMLADTKPIIAPLDQDAWAHNLNYLDSPPLGTGRVLWFGTSSQPALAAKSQGFRTFQVSFSSGDATRYDRCGPCRENGRARRCSPATD